MKGATLCFILVVALVLGVTAQQHASSWPPTAWPPHPDAIVNVTSQTAPFGPVYCVPQDRYLVVTGVDSTVPTLWHTSSGVILRWTSGLSVPINGPIGWVVGPGETLDTFPASDWAMSGYLVRR